MMSKISSIINERSGQIVDLLANLLSFRSTVGNEQEAQKYLATYLLDLGFDPEMLPIHPGIESHPDYTNVPGHSGYDGRENLVLTVPGSGGGKGIILNSHIDVVPGSDDLFEPYVGHGIVRGRGACDAKGQIVTAVLALIALKEAGIQLKGNVVFQSVIEEEAGGNGSLSVVLDGIRADGVVVMEPSGLNVFPANRGAVWFKLTVQGKPTHMGRWRDGVNAIEEIIRVIGVLKEYEQKLVAQSAGDPLFPDVAANVIVNVGTIQGGEWPSMVPGQCTVEGGIGFLPNKRLADIKEEIASEITNHCSSWVRDHYTLEFNRLHNEAYRLPPDHPLVQTLYTSALSVDVNSKITGFTASCDARLFWHTAKLPTVVFGPGEFSYAHSQDEQISIAEIKTAANILVRFLMQWCGVDTTSC
ncbi:MAG: ArgE/DapE family deacylase [Armatimonadota bacterium]